VRIDPTVWDEEVARFAERSPARVAAECGRGGLERDGISLTSLLACEPRAEVVKTIGQNVPQGVHRGWA
jgi:hypothetical protein